MGAAAEADPTVLYVSGWCRSGSTVLGNVLAEVTPADQTPAEHAAEVVAWQAGCRTRHTWRVLHGRPAGGGWPAVLAATYRAVAEVTGAEVLVDTSKYASDAAWLWRLDGIRPAQLHLVRDPRAAACAHPGGSLRVRHEDLTADPRAVVGRVLALAGRPDAANPVAAGGTVTLGANHAVTGDPVRFERGPTRLQGGQGCRAGLPARQRALVTAVALPLLHRYRYLGHPEGD